MNKILWLALTICLVGQVVPFHLEYPSRLDVSELPVEYIDSFLEAEQHSRSLDGAAIWSLLSTFPAAFLLLSYRLPIRIEQRWCNTRKRWPARIAFLVGVALWMKLVALPYALLTYLARADMGITNMVFSEWLRLLIVGLPFPLLLFSLRCLLVYCAMPIFGRSWWLAAALLVFLIFSVIPEWISRTRPIDPIVTTTRLPDGDVRDELARVAAVAGFQLDYYVDDTSNRSRTVNMYVTGRLGREYVGLTDTIITSFTTGELSAVMAHELWHQIVRRKSALTRWGIGLASALVSFYVVFLKTRRSRIDDPLRLHTLVILLVAQSALSFAWTPLTSALGRQEERDADRYALQLLQQPELLKSAILKASRINATPFTIPGWIYGFSASHPTVKERLAFADRWHISEPESLGAELE